MRYAVHYTSRFKKSLKRAQGLKAFKVTTFKHVVTLLASGQALPAKFKDHKLTGNLKDFRECHLAPDILLIYQIDEGVLALTLVNIGNHGQLFQ